MDKSIVDAKTLLTDYDNCHKDKCSKIGDKGNQVLYDLCRESPKHTDESEIRAKIWLIGRAYSVAIERRKKHLVGKSKKSNDEFYSFVTGKIVKFHFDRYIKKIPKTTLKLNEANIKIICDAHQYLTDRFKYLTGLNQRSLASKYLHFHRPLVPIYDSRARMAIKNILKKSNKCLEKYKRGIDVKNVEPYRSFVEKIFCFQRFLWHNKRRKCTMRNIDKYLIWKAG